MHVFLSVSFSRKVDASGDVFAEYRHDLEELIELIRGAGHTVFCAPENDGWNIKNLSAIEAYQVDIDGLDKADVFIGLLESARPSTGVCMEIMRAAMQHKPSLIITDQGNPVYMIQGMVEAEPFVQHVVCPDQTARLAAIKKQLAKL